MLVEQDQLKVPLAVAVGLDLLDQMHLTEQRVVQGETV
jgi:hypothetical protein